MQMKNPFELLEVTTTEDEEQAELIRIPVEERHKKPHHMPRVHRKLPIESNNIPQLNQPVTFNEPLPQRLKCFHHYPYMEKTKWLYTHKELPEGHYLDRQSGMGREDRVKKAGGGYHSVGNIKDQLNRQKYEREDPEENPEVPQKPRQLEVNEPVIENKTEESRRITLLQYYRSKGIDLDSIPSYKAPVKKTTIDKQWFNKERLNLLQTKEDLKNKQRKDRPFSKHPEGRFGLNIDKSIFEKLGFGKQPYEEQPRYEEYRDEGIKNRSMLSTEDFPTL